MKGYIVGYFDSWANERNSVIVGYYTAWTRAINATKELERNNINHKKSLQQVYLVEIEVNKTYPIINSDRDWIDSYTNYKLRTINGITTLRSNKGRISKIDLSMS